MYLLLLAWRTAFGRSPYGTKDEFLAKRDACVSVCIVYLYDETIVQNSFESIQSFGCSTRGYRVVLLNWRHIHCSPHLYLLYLHLSAHHLLAQHQIESPRNLLSPLSSTPEITHPSRGSTLVQSTPHHNPPSLPPPPQTPSPPLPSIPSHPPPT